MFSVPLEFAVRPPADSQHGVLAGGAADGLVENAAVAQGHGGGRQGAAAEPAKPGATTPLEPTITFPTLPVPLSSGRAARRTPCRWRAAAIDGQGSAADRRRAGDRYCCRSSVSVLAPSLVSPTDAPVIVAGIGDRAGGIGGIDAQRRAGAERRVSEKSGRCCRWLVEFHSPLPPTFTASVAMLATETLPVRIVAGQGAGGFRFEHAAADRGRSRGRCCCPSGSSVPLPILVNPPPPAIEPERVTA